MRMVLLLTLLLGLVARTPAQEPAIDILLTRDQAGRECLVTELTEVRLCIELPPSTGLEKIWDNYHQVIEMRRAAIRQNPRLDLSKMKMPFVVDDPHWGHILAWAWLNRYQLGSLNIGHAWIWIRDAGRHVQWEFSPHKDCFGTDVNNERHHGRLRCNRGMHPTHSLPMLLGPESMKRLYGRIEEDLRSRLVFNVFGHPGRNCLGWAVETLMASGAELPDNMDMIHELGFAVAMRGKGLEWIQHRPGKREHP